MAARGRGRGGRGSSHSTKQGVDRQPKVPRSIEELKDYLVSLNEGNFKSYGEPFANMVLDFSSDDQKLKDVVSLIFDVVTEDRDSSSLGAKICAAISKLNPNETEIIASKRKGFRKFLLSRFQSEFGNKGAIRSASIEQWLSVFSFLCEVFHHIRIGGNPITVVGKAISSGMEWLLSQEDCDDDEAECVCYYLKMTGNHLEVVTKEKVDSVVCSLRKQAISRKTSCKVRCIILEVLEFRAMGWKDRDGELDQFYLDAIADAAVEDDLSRIKNNR